MAKINSGTITANGSGVWTSEAITLTSGSKRVYLRVNGTQELYRDFTVASFSIASTTSYKRNTSSTTAPVTVSSIPSGALVVVFGTTHNIEAASAVTSANLAFSNRARSTNSGSGNTQTDIWTAVAGSTLTNEAITFTVGTTAHPGIAAVVIQGANTTSLSNVVTSSGGGTNEETITVTTVAANSIVIGALSTNSNAVAYTTSAGTTELVDLNEDDQGSSMWVGHKTTVTSTGAYTIGATPSLGEWLNWAGAAIEIRPA